jgi:hypothetical protein
MPVYVAPTCEALETSIPHLPKLYKGDNKKRLAAIKRIAKVYMQCSTSAIPELQADVDLLSLKELGPILAQRKLIPEKRAAILAIVSLCRWQIWNEKWVGTPEEKRLGVIHTNGKIDNTMKWMVGKDTVEGFFKTGSTLNTQLDVILGLANQQLDQYHELYNAAALSTHLEAMHPTPAKTADGSTEHEIELMDFKLEPKKVAPVSIVIDPNVEFYKSQPLPTIEEIDVAQPDSDNVDGMVEIQVDEIDPAKLETPHLFAVTEPDDEAAEFKQTVSLSTDDITLSQMSEEYLTQNLKACQYVIEKVLLKRHFSAATVREKFAQIVETYLKLKAEDNDDTENPKRQQWLHFIRAINAELTHYGEGDFNHSYSNRMRQAVLYLIMEELDEERYAVGKVLRSTSGKLNTLCKEALNIESIAEVSLLERYNYHSILEAFFTTNIDFACSECKEHLNKIDNFNRFSKDMLGKLKRRSADEYTRMENGELNATLNYVRIAIDVGMGFILAVAIGAASNALIPVAGPSLIGRGIGAWASRSYGYFGGRAATEAVTYVEQSLASTLAKKAAKSVIAPLAQVPGATVYYTLNLPFRVYELISKSMAAPVEKPFYESPEFINMLLSLPDKHLSAEKKAILRNIDLRFPNQAPAEEKMAEPQMRMKA